MDVQLVAHCGKAVDAHGNEAPDDRSPVESAAPCKYGSLTKDHGRVKDVDDCCNHEGVLENAVQQSFPARLRKDGLFVKPAM